MISLIAKNARYHKVLANLVRFGRSGNFVANCLCCKFVLKLEVAPLQTVSGTIVLAKVDVHGMLFCFAQELICHCCLVNVAIYFLLVGCCQGCH